MKIYFCTVMRDYVTDPISFTVTRAHTHTQETLLLIVQLLIFRVSGICVSVGRQRWPKTFTSLRRLSQAFFLHFHCFGASGYLSVSLSSFLSFHISILLLLFVFFSLVFSVTHTLVCTVMFQSRSEIRYINL